MPLTNTLSSNQLTLIRFAASFLLMKVTSHASVGEKKVEKKRKENQRRITSKNLCHCIECMCQRCRSSGIKPETKQKTAVFLPAAECGCIFPDHLYDSLTWNKKNSIPNILHSKESKRRMSLLLRSFIIVSAVTVTLFCRLIPVSGSRSLLMT